MCCRNGLGTWPISIYSVVLTVYLLVWPFIVLANQTTTRYVHSFTKLKPEHSKLKRTRTSKKKHKNIQEEARKHLQLKLKRLYKM